MSFVLKGKTSPLQTGKCQNHIVNVDILILVNVENCQRGQPLRTHGAANDRVLRRGTLRKMKILQAVQKVTVCRYVCLRGLRSSGYEISFHLLYDLIYDWFITRDEPRIKFGSIVLMRSMCSMLFDGFDVVRCVRCGSMCSMSSMSSMLCGKICRKLSSI